MSQISADILLYTFSVYYSLFTVHFLATSFGKYARLAGILEIAFDGQVLAIEQSLQF